MIFLLLMYFFHGNAAGSPELGQKGFDAQRALRVQAVTFETFG